VKICILSDSHDRADPLARAVLDAKALGAQAVIHCGDLIGAQTIKPALVAGLPIHAIHGNNLAALELGGRSIVVVHYDHHGYAMACTGNWDLVCCGHSHRAEARQVANVKGGTSWLVNPGTVAGLAAPATWILGDLAAMRFETHTLNL